MQLILDTHQTIRDLLTHGYNQEQAEGFVQVLQKMNLKNFATKQDIEGVKGEIERVETKLEYKLREIELRLTVRMGSMIIALGAVLIGIKYFG